MNTFTFLWLPMVSEPGRWTAESALFDGMAPTAAPRERPPALAVLSLPRSSCIVSGVVSRIETARQSMHCSVRVV